MIYIPVTQNYQAIIDESDSYLFDYTWSIHRAKNTCYCGTWTSDNKFILMHRMITKADDMFDVHHKDHNGLNNTRQNLVVCTHQNNVRARSPNKKSILKYGYKGVSYDKTSVKRPYFSRICVDYKSITLGHFETAKEAAIAYDNAAVKYHGEFACTNKELGLLNV